MAAIGQTISVTTSPTLIFEVIDERTYNTLVSPATNIFPAHEAGDALPIMISLPSGSTVYFGGSAVDTTGCAIFGPTTMAYNAVGSDSLYAVITGSDVGVGLLVLRQ
jgi:hypothetical protein